MKVKRDFTALIYLIIFLLLVLASCSSKGTSVPNIENQLAELQNHVTSLTDRISILEQENRALKDEVSELNHTYRAEKEGNHTFNLENDREIRSKISVLEKLVYNLQDITHQKGYITQNTQQDSVYTIEFENVEMLSGEEAILAVMEEQKVSREEVSLPNGFYIREYPHIRKKAVVDKETLTFILDGAGQKSVSLSDFLEYQNNVTYKSMYNFYMMNDKIVVIQEQYLP